MAALTLYAACGLPHTPHAGNPVFLYGYSFDKSWLNQSFVLLRFDRRQTAMSKPAKTPMPPASGLFLDNQLCFALYAASLAMTKTYRPLLAPLGLTYPQYVVMLALWQHTELTAGALAQVVALDSGTLVPLVRKLVSQGLLLRQRSTADDRSVRITLTPAGRALQQRAPAVHDQVACNTQCSAPERQAMTTQLRALRGALSSALVSTSGSSPRSKV